MQFFISFFMCFFAFTSLKAEGEFFQEIVKEEGISILEKPNFGRVLYSQNILMKTQKDEAMFHEMLVHPALIAHGKALSVLILGGADGGSLREVVRHREVEKIVLVEPKIRWIEIAKQYLPGFSNQAFEDRRVHLVHQDLSSYLQESEDVFDVIICDFSHPNLLDVGTFSKTFYVHCKKHLSSNGILVHQTRSPFIEKGGLKRCLKTRKEVFSHATFYVASIPSIEGGFAVFAWSSPQKHRMTGTMLKKRLSLISGKMQYYTPFLQKGAFQLPRYLLEDAGMVSNQKKSRIF
jgi:spermidine synthase